MILAYHSIFGMYGFWLPNDPRGSGSDYIASWELLRYGPATKTDSRRSVAHRPLPPNWQCEAKTALQWPPASVTGRQALSIGEGFATAAGEGPYRIYACAILPEHVHLVIGVSSRRIRAVVGHLKSRAHTCFEAGAVVGRRPAAVGSAWLECLWGNGRSRRASHPIREREPVEGGEETAELVLRRPAGAAGSAPHGDQRGGPAPHNPHAVLAALR